MANGNDFFAKMCREAAEELAGGEKGWKELDSNTLMMACFHLLTNHLSHKIDKLSRSIMWFAASVGAATITYIVTSFLSRGI